MPREIHPDLLNHEFTLDGIVFPPSWIPRFESSEVDLSMQLTERVKLMRPLLSSPMDSVTGSDMAITMALSGSIGVIHHGYPTIEDQAAEVVKVRRYEAAFILNPVVLPLNSTVGGVLDEAEKRGFGSFPITTDGKLSSHLEGIVTNRDVRFKKGPEWRGVPITHPDVMTPREKLIVGNREDTLDIGDVHAANELIERHNLDTLLIVDREGKVVAIVTDKDLKKNEKHTLATKDDNKQLLVYAAVKPRYDEANRNRIDMLAQVGATGIFIDSRQLFGGYAETASFAKKRHLDVFVGNVVRPSVLREALEEAGRDIDGFRVGIGTGEVCITTEDTGLGQAMGSALLALDGELREINNREQYGPKVLIVDGGIKKPAHFLGAIMLGGHAIMQGTALAGFEESPTEVHQRKDGSRFKVVRGMGSEGAIKDRSGAGAARYGSDLIDLDVRYPEGIEKEVPYLGKGEPRLALYWAGVRTAIHGMNARNLKELYENAVIYPAVPAVTKGTV